MARYMKSAMPFPGVPSSALRATVRELAKWHPLADVAQLAATVMDLWDAATFRQERYAAPMDPLLRQWSGHPNLWFRRAAIIAQLLAKSAPDTQLLDDVVTANLADGEFFVRKALGRALRQYARTVPAWVRDFVASHEGALSPLSRREALKHL